MRLVGLVVFLVAWTFIRPVAADPIDANVAQLDSGERYKVRLAAAVWLAKTRDSRAIEALVSTLDRESSRSIRRVAALALGKMVDNGTPASLRERAKQTLRHAAERDTDDKVRRNASRSLERIDALGTLVRSPAGSASVFVNVGKITDRTAAMPKGSTDLLRNVVRISLRKHAPNYLVRWPSSQLPTSAELKQQNAQAYSVRIVVTKYQINKRGNMAEIRCAVTMQVNPWLGRDVKEKWLAHETASATGSGHVMANNTRRGISVAKKDCILAVGEQMTSQQVVPFLKRLVASRQ